MKLNFEEENLSNKQECSALTSNLEGTALNCVMAKRQMNVTALVRTLTSCSGVQGHQEIVKLKRVTKEMTSPLTSFWITSSCSEGEINLTRESQKRT